MNYQKSQNKRLDPEIDIEYLSYIYDRTINMKAKLTDVVYTQSNFDNLVEMYKKPVSYTPLIPRSYHDFLHIIEGVKDIVSIENSCDCENGSLDDVLLAWFYHDSIYTLNPKTNNEVDSAWYAFNDLISMGFSAQRAGKIYDLILWTKHDKDPSQENYEANLIIDIDLLRLSTTPVEVFFNLTRMVRQEFSFVDDATWSEGRINFWKGILQRKGKRIFRTNHFEHLNDLAISNIEKEIFSLERGRFL